MDYIAHQAPLSMGFPKQEYWSGLPFPAPGDLPNPGVKPRFPALQVDSLATEPPRAYTSLTTLAGNHLLTCVSAKLDYNLPESLDSVCSLWDPQGQSE